MDVLGVEFTIAGVTGPPTGGPIATEAGTSAEGGGGFGLFEGAGMIGMWVLMLVALWFFMFRPQRKREKETRNMQNNLNVGENIVTTSGFFGKIVGVGTDSFLIEFGEGRGFKVWVRKSDIAGIKSPVMTPPKADSTE